MPAVYWPLMRQFTKDGDGTSYNAVGDYSITPAYWELRPPATEVWYISRMMPQIGDIGILSADDYGGIGALDPGLVMNVVRGTGAGAVEVYPLTDLPITTNNSWTLYAYDSKPDDYGAGENFVGARLSFDKFYRKSERYPGLIISGAHDEALRITLAESFAGLETNCWTGEGTRKVLLPELPA